MPTRFEDLFDEPPDAGAREPEAPDAWDRLLAGIGGTVPATRLRRVRGGWDVGVDGLVGFLADEESHSDAPVQTEVTVLRLDRDRGVLDLSERWRWDSEEGRAMLAFLRGERDP